MEDGQSLISAVDAFQPDVIVTDISMPRINGIEAVRIIVQKNPASRIILLTAHNDSALLQEGLSAGALGYVLKLEKEKVEQARDAYSLCRRTAGFM